MDIKCSVIKKPCKRLPLWRLATGTELINPVHIPGSTLGIGTVTLGYDKRNYPLFLASPPWFLHPVVLSLCLFRVLQHFVSLNSLNKFTLWIKFGAFFIWETLTYREKSNQGFPSRLPHDIEQSSMCYRVSSYWSSILNIAVYICQSQTPEPYSFPSATINSFSWVSFCFIK